LPSQRRDETPTPVGQTERQKLHGRRKGRPLRAGLQRLVEQRLPELSLAAPSGGGTLKLDRLFTSPRREIWLEIGFGGGEHLARQAADNPEIGFIGAEVFLNGIASLLRHIAQDGLDNVRLWREDAQMLLPILGDAALGRVFLLFPDPWPKQRHHKRRFLRPQNLDELARVLAPGALLRVATDDASYLRWILRHLLDHPDFEWTARGPQEWRQRPADWPTTRYEGKALAQGRRPCYLTFRRRADGRDETP